MATEGTAVRAGSWIPFAQAHLERSLRDSVVPQSRASLRGAVRDTEQTTEGMGAALFAGVTGGNSPHYTNLPTKGKITRVLVKYFFDGTRAAILTGERVRAARERAATASGARGGGAVRAIVGFGAAPLRRHGRCGRPVPRR